MTPISDVSAALSNIIHELVAITDRTEDPTARARLLSVHHDLASAAGALHLITLRLHDLHTTWLAVFPPPSPETQTKIGSPT